MIKNKYTESAAWFSKEA